MLLAQDNGKPPRRLLVYLLLVDSHRQGLISEVAGDVLLAVTCLTAV